MLTWLATKASLKKIWVWLKHNWYVPAVVIYTLILWIFFRRKDKAFNVLKIRSKSYEKQINAINEIHKEEIEKRDAIIEKYKNVLEAIEKDYTEKKKELEANKMKEIKELVEENIDNPGNLAKLISERYGITYIESGDLE